MAKNKLTKVNVPEKFYSFFLSKKDTTQSTLLQKLAAIQPTKRGRGYSRVIPELTAAEWDELYSLAIDARGHMQGAEERETELVGAICAKVLCERMESLGVSNPQPYVPSRTVTRAPKPVAPTADTTADNTATDDTDLSSSAPTTPVPGDLTVQQVTDVEEADEDDLSAIGGDIALGG